jgi:integrase
MAARKRRFGRVRQLPSKRWQARYRGPDAMDHPAPITFATKRDAEIWLVNTEAEIRAGEWVNPVLGDVTFAVFASSWMADRILKPRTAELYDGLLRNHLLPSFGNRLIGDIREPQVRRWRKERLDAGPAVKRPFGPVTVAKAYRLLHAILSTAADDKLISRNPCNIKGAGEEHSPERPVLTLPVFLRLLDRVQPRHRALLLLATFASLRFGELAALQRSNLDLDGSVVLVVRSTAQMNDGRLIEQEPKSRAGRRTVAFPREIVGELRWHLESFAEPGPDGLVFVGPKGGRLRRSNFRELWLVALKDAGITDLHLHDLRHTGNTMAAATGASLRELMERMGHSSSRAAMIYQHASRDRDEAIAAAMGTALTAARKGSRRSSSGTQRARGRGKPS